MENVVVGIAEGKVIKGSGELVTYALGSCMGICLYDRRNKVAGMAHILLPFMEESPNQNNGYKFADTGIRMLVDEMKKSGATPENLMAKIVGGAEMFEGAGKLKSNTGYLMIGQKNIEAVKKVLGQMKIPIVAEDVGGNAGRTIYFSADTGKLSVKTVRWAWKDL